MIRWSTLDIVLRSTHGGIVVMWEGVGKWKEGVREERKMAGKST